MKHGLIALVAAVGLLGSLSRAEHGICSANPGTTCWGKNRYVRYDAGALPVIVSVPHGGSVAPPAIPDRTGTTVTDLHTIELGRAIVSAFERRTGQSPHLVVCLLRRTKLDANRDVGEAAQGQADAVRAWTDYHGFIETAIGRVRGGNGRGLYIDLHGHGHQQQRLELGYLLSAAALAQDDTRLDGDGNATRSSLRTVPGASSFSALVRGRTSLGGLLGSRFPSVPSPAIPSPGSDPYFGGGYSTARHTAHIAGLQIETNSGVRDTEPARAAFAEALVDALSAFAREHLRLTL